jgi:hypothetical protein
MHTDPVLRCFDNPEELNYGDFPSQRGSRACELANDLRPGATVPSHDLSEALSWFMTTFESRGAH